jgi:NADPH:quinone reductase-like Zn-dependent oxidoreductase
MKAVICTKYGAPEVLQLKEVEKPVPRDNEVLIRIHATTITAGDIRIRSFHVPASQRLLTRIFLGFRKPRKPILGIELAGEIEAIGKEVTRFKKGDPIFASTLTKFGAYAEYICLPESGIITIKPTNSTFEEAAAIPIGGLTALYFLRRADIKGGKRILIYGASGSVGSYAVQLARYLGANVTAVCSASNMEWVKSLGADQVIDYKKEDFTKRGELYDIIFDAVGKTSRDYFKNAFTSTGVYVSVEGQGIAKQRIEDLIFLKGLFETGYLKPVIDRKYVLEHIVEAHRYVEEGHKKGNVVITVD